MRSAFRRPEFSPRGWSLRTRLVVLLIALAVIGLAAADFASYRALHNYLYDRVAQQLESAVAPVTFGRIRQAEAEESGAGGVFNVAPAPKGPGFREEGGPPGS